MSWHGGISAVASAKKTFMIINDGKGINGYLGHLVQDYSKLNSEDRKILQLWEHFDRFLVVFSDLGFA